MEEKLEMNSHKGGWDGMTPGELLRRIKQEVGELTRAIEKNRSALDVAREAADVANFCRMLADLAQDYEEDDMTYQGKRKPYKDGDDDK